MRCRFPHITSAFLGSTLVFPYAAQQLIARWWSNGMRSLTIRCLDRQKTLDLFNNALTTSGRLLERLDLNCFQRGHDVFVETVRSINYLPNVSVHAGASGTDCNVRSNLSLLSRVIIDHRQLPLR